MTVFVVITAFYIIYHEREYSLPWRRLMACVRVILIRERVNNKKEPNFRKLYVYHVRHVFFPPSVSFIMMKKNMKKNSSKIFFQE